MFVLGWLLVRSVVLLPEITCGSVGQSLGGAGTWHTVSTTQLLEEGHGRPAAARPLTDSRAAAAAGQRRHSDTAPR